MIMRKKEQLLELNKEDLIKIIEEQEKEMEKLNGAMHMIVKHNILLENKLMKNPQSGEAMYYRQDWCYVDKLVFILKLKKQPLQSSELLELLLKHDEYANYWRNKVKSLSVHLNKAVKYKKILSYKVPGKNGLDYGLPEWIDE